MSRIVVCICFVCLCAFLFSGCFHRGAIDLAEDIALEECHRETDRYSSGNEDAYYQDYRCENGRLYSCPLDCTSYGFGDENECVHFQECYYTGNRPTLEGVKDFICRVHKQRCR